jgi:hypothetical protein
VRWGFSRFSLEIFYIVLVYLGYTAGDGDALSDKGIGDRARQFSTPEAR